ncbi:MAG TPA: TRAP transporter permease [Azospirillaceae bacterium]|nr:TRAP transporter permease [Azospirillaceae bacterium]
MTAEDRLVIDEEAVRRAVEKDNPVNAHLSLSPFDQRAIYAVGVAFAVFQLWTATFNPLSSLVVRSIHVGFLLLLAFLLLSAREGMKRSRVPWYDWALGALAFAIGLYHLVFEKDLLLRSGDPTATDLVIGAVNILLVAEAARRVMGWGLPAFCLAFIPFAYWGRELPSIFAHRGYGLDQIIDQLQFSTEGIYGTPIFVSSTFIFLFILFGSFLERAGVIGLFNDISLGLVGRTKGGPAKVAVISSGLMGTVNGSGVANVLTTGQFTIPLMKRFGYRPAFAGAVEATASMGGQLMPPVMGAAAFIMAETIGVSYAEICKAAAIPAILYFASAFWMSHLEAGRYGLKGLPPEECPSALRAVVRGWYLLLPLAALVVLLFAGFTPLFAGVVGIAGTVALMLGTRIAQQARTQVLRVVFWAALALIAAGLYRARVPVEFVASSLVALLVVPSFFFRGGRETLRGIVDSLADGARAAVSVGLACALVGILIGVLSLTGTASAIAGIIVDLSGGVLIIALLLTMVACIVLGTGLPTTANYIITASIAAPALLELGVPLIVSHMFVFYFGIMADLTPPVALAALAASPIARAGHMEIGWIATRIAAAGYLVPFMAVYDPSLMLQAGTWLDTAYMVFKAGLGIVLWGAASIGFLWKPLSFVERVAMAGAALLLVVALPLTDELGFAAAAVLLGWHWFATRRATATA